ncbi:MAG: beta-phosphoglucomutase family hydrolase [Candidatus Solibacter sp.]
MIALLFDMDGVIVDSNPMHCEAWTAFNLRYGLETTGAMLQRMYGRRNDQIVRDFFGEQLTAEEVDARGRAKEQLYREMVGERIDSMLVPGLRDFLARHQDLPLAVASNAEPENVEFVLERSGLRPYFRAVVDGHQVNRPKPFPDVYLRAAELLGVPPARCVVFEDSPSGAAAALAAGMPVIGLSTTYVNLQGAVLTIDNFSSGELEAWLTRQGRSV